MAPKRKLSQLARAFDDIRHVKQVNPLMGGREESTRSSKRLRGLTITDTEHMSMPRVDEAKHIQNTTVGASNPNAFPFPWKGRLGYACLNTYLRTATPPVFCSRTCRLASILEQQHPLQDPLQPPHRTKNRPDLGQPAETSRGQRYLESLGLANARDLALILQWNEQVGIRFFRLSSDMFPFASHGEHGYALEPFAADALAAAGRVAAAYGHRLTTHPGQYTQLGSPRTEVVTAAVRDLSYHAEMLRLLCLPPQQDRDAVMVVHMGGVFGDKAATLQRFADAYRTKLDDGVRSRLVLENDDVAWSVLDLLPVCEDLGIPLVLDYHHHSIIYDDLNDCGDPPSVAAGTEVAARIWATWTAKGITPKMHYSEPSAGPLATPHQRRKHSARVVSMPPCPKNADLMIEAKDKEQAVFDLMRKFMLPGHERINDILPHERDGEGTFSGRVYWPEGCEDWLKPKRADKYRRNSLKKET